MEQIDPRRLLIQIVQILEQLNIHYLITGGIAVLVWGRPRFTADIDIVIELKKSDISKLESALKRLGKSGYVDKTAIERALVKEGEFNFIDGKTGVKVDFWILKKDAFDTSRLKRKIGKKFLGHTVYFTSPEDLILIKLVWHKETESARQLEDVESILKISGQDLNKKYLKVWAKKLDVEDILNTLWKKLKLPVSFRKRLRKS